jgi:hypothetical protein
MGRHCNLGHVIDPKYRVNLGEDLTTVAATETIFALDLEVKPNSGTHLLKPGTYKLAIQVAASNCKPVTQIVELSCRGKWFTDEERMFSEGIEIKLVNSI